MRIHLLYIVLLLCYCIPIHAQWQIQETPEGEELRRVTVLHYDFDDISHEGVIICHESIASDIRDIFMELYAAHYPIHSIRPINEYGNDDELSMTANNSSAYCFRTINGSTKLSKHALGMAIDINPLQNPCVKVDRQGRISHLEPNTPEARRYALKRHDMPHAITPDDLAYKLFIAHGFRWGGAWRSKKDYQHFEK